MYMHANSEPLASLQASSGRPTCQNPRAVCMDSAITTLFSDHS